MHTLKSKTIRFKNIDEYLKLTLLKELLNLIKEIKTIKHILIIGIGNDNYIADSIGPKTLKNIKVNYFNKRIKVSSLEPGTIHETGISTFKIINSLVKEIKPDVVILIDSFITDNICDLNRSIIVNNYGITSSLGIKNINDSITNVNLNTNVITIGIPTVLELKVKSSIPYILSKKDVDSYVFNMSNLIGNVLNKIIYEIL